MAWTQERARLAALSRHHPDGPEVDDARRDLRAARAEDYIRELVDQAPPLTDDQRRRLVAILAGAT